MDSLTGRIAGVLAVCLAACHGGGADPARGPASAPSGEIGGVSGTSFELTARADSISTADGHSLYAWGYAVGAGRMQYPGPTLIVNQGDVVTVDLGNELPVPVSIVFPGQEGVATSGGTTGLLAAEAPPGGSVRYSFTAARPGTFLYHSGTQPELQVPLGLVGALIVRPSGYDESTNRIAYGHASTAFDREYLFLLTEVDPRFNDLAMQGRLGEIDGLDFEPRYWFINGRTSPDTMAEMFVPWLPTQPYNAMPRMHPGERILMRAVNAGRDLHPFHHHGNNTRTIARDGNLLESAPGAGADLAVSDFTLKTVPGQTLDAVFEWTGKALGWDVYGHRAADPLQPGEYAADHGKPFPVVLPDLQELTFGEHYSGSPFLGAFGALPADHVSLNATAGYFFMWHSHTEREITNNDVFPGGMMTMMIVEHPGVPIGP